MKRWIMFALAAVVVGMLPKGQQIDVGKLNPAELIYIYKEDSLTVVLTDTGDAGWGDTLEKALDDLRSTSFGEVFLDTVDYILVTEETKSVLPKLENHFRLSSNIFLASGEVDLKKVAEFLSVHNPERTLLDSITRKEKLPKLMTAGERYYLE